MSNELIQQKQITTVNDIMREFKEMGATIVGNETYINAPPPLGFIHAYEVVNICKDPAFKEVYPQKGGGLSLTAVALKKLGKAMGIRFGPGEVVSRATDGQGRTKSIIYRSTACCRGLDGQFSWSQMDYEFDLTKRREEIENTQNALIRKWTSGTPQEKASAPPDFKVCRTQDEIQAFRDEKVRLDMIQIEKNALTRAQTGAMTRCIRDLGAFPSTYTPQQLEKPFLVPKLVVYYEATNPIDRAFALEQTKTPMMMFPQHASRSMQATPPSIATQPLTQLSLEAQAPAEQPMRFNLPDPLEAEELSQMVEARYTESEIQLHEMEMSPQESAMMDFEACDPSDRIACIQGLIKDKNWKGKIHKPFENFTPAEMKNFFLMLLKLPNPGESKAAWE